MCFLFACGAAVAVERCSHVAAAHLGRRAQFGYTVLMLSAEKGHADCARLLLDAGADKEAKNHVRASWSAARSCVDASICVLTFGGYD